MARKTNKRRKRNAAPVAVHAIGRGALKATRVLRNKSRVTLPLSALKRVYRAGQKGVQAVVRGRVH
jgi:hypothetical protein